MAASPFSTQSTTRSNAQHTSLFRSAGCLSVATGAPLRLLVPVKLGLKNVKAITKIMYVAEEPRDYWAERGYSRYDGI